METLFRIKELIEKISIDTNKVFKKGNRSASIRARKHAQELKELITPFRKEVLDEITRQHPRKTSKNKAENLSPND
jgi:hypothetical protein